MSDLRNVLQEVLNILSEHGQYGIDKVKIMLKKKLEQPQQEPVGEVVEHETSSGESVCFGEIDAQLVHIGDKLYAHPSNVRRLSDAEIRSLIHECTTNHYDEDGYRDSTIDGEKLADLVQDACNMPKGGE